MRLKRSPEAAGDDRADLQAIYEDVLFAPVKALSPAHSALRGIYFTDGLVGNGGLQALLDADPELAGPLLDEAVAGCELMGAFAHGEVLREFVAAGLASPTGQAVRDACERGEETSVELNTTIDTLDAKYFALPSIDEPLTRYVRAHPDEFAGDPHRNERQPEPIDEAGWLARCPEFIADATAFERTITTIAQTIRSEGLQRNGNEEEVTAFARAHVLTYLANADESDRVTRKELTKSAIQCARMID